MKWYDYAAILLFVILIIYVAFDSGREIAAYKACVKSGGTYFKVFGGYECIKR